MYHWKYRLLSGRQPDHMPEWLQWWYLFVMHSELFWQVFWSIQRMRWYVLNE